MHEPTAMSVSVDVNFEKSAGNQLQNFSLTSRGMLRSITAQSCHNPGVNHASVMKAEKQACKPPRGLKNGHLRETVKQAVSNSWKVNYLDVMVVPIQRAEIRVCISAHTAFPINNKQKFTLLVLLSSLFYILAVKFHASDDMGPHLVYTRPPFELTVNLPTRPSSYTLPLLARRRPCQWNHSTFNGTKNDCLMRSLTYVLRYIPAPMMLTRRDEQKSSTQKALLHHHAVTTASSLLLHVNFILVQQ